MNTFMTFDAQAATSFIVSQRAHIETEINRTVYPDIQYPGLIPVDTSANPFTQTVTYYSSDMFGKAEWINGNADDIPIAGTERTAFKTSVYTAAIGYGFGWEEVNQAMRDGVNLQTEDAAAARRAYEEMVDRVALYGDTEKGFKGIANYTGVTVVAAPVGNWVSATDAQILSDFNTLITGQGQATKYTSLADTLLMPIEALTLLGTRRLGDTTINLLNWLMENNVYTQLTGQRLTIRTLRGLETAGAGSTRRIVAYRRDPQVLKMHIPMPHRFFPVFQDGPLHWVVPGVFRLGGVDIRRTSEVRYMDGI